MQMKLIMHEQQAWIKVQEDTKTKAQNYAIKINYAVNK